MTVIRDKIKLLISYNHSLTTDENTISFINPSIVT